MALMMGEYAGVRKYSNWQQFNRGEYHKKLGTFQKKFIQDKSEELTNWNPFPHREDSCSALGIQETETLQIFF